MDRMRYARSFNEIRDELTAEEAVKAAAREPSAPWRSAEDVPPQMTLREVPTSAYRATVAYPSPGSWRQAGDDCVMTPDGSVRVLGSDPSLGALVRYGRVGVTSATGADSCGDGTIAFVPAGDLFTWPMAGASENRRREVGAKLSGVAGQILKRQGVN